MRNLKKLRRDAGLTQHELASATSIHRWRISHAELGMLKLTPNEVEAIRQVLATAIQKKSRALAQLTAA
jgi:predicted transcriptional regulator